MRYLIITALCSVLFTPSALTKDHKNDSLEDAVRDEIRDAVYGDDHRQGKGRPDNPGEHGRENAEDKQRKNKGKSKGAGNHDSLEDRILEEFEDSDDHGKKKKKNK